MSRKTPLAYITIHGLTDLKGDLKNLAPTETRQLLSRVVYRLGQIVRDKIRDAAPVRTGALRRSIKVRKNRPKGNYISCSVVADESGGRSGGGFYWHFLEFGTVNMSEQPFVSPSVEQVRPDAPKLLRQHFAPEYERQLQKRAKKAKKR